MNATDPTGQVAEEIVVIGRRAVTAVSSVGLVGTIRVIGSFTSAGIRLASYAVSAAPAADGTFCNGRAPCVLANEKPYAGETPDDKPEDFEPLGPREGHKSKPLRDKEDGSVWEKDKSQHGGSEWKRWPSKRDWEKDRNRESVRPDGSVR